MMIMFVILFLWLLRITLRYVGKNVSFFVHLMTIFLFIHIPLRIRVPLCMQYKIMSHVARSLNKTQNLHFS